MLNKDFILSTFIFANHSENRRIELEKKIKEENEAYLKEAQDKTSKLYGWYEKAINILKSKTTLGQGYSSPSDASYEPSVVFHRLIRLTKTKILDVKELSELEEVIRASAQYYLTKNLCNEMLNSIHTDYSEPVSPIVAKLYINLIKEYSKKVFSETEVIGLQTTLQSLYNKMIQKALNNYLWSHRDINSVIANRDPKKETEENFKLLIETINNCFVMDSEACIKEVETIITQLSAEKYSQSYTYIAIHKQNFLTLLILLRKFSDPAFERQASLIKNDKKKMTDFTNVLLTNDFQDFFKGTSLSIENVVHTFLNHYATVEKANEYAFKRDFANLLQFKKELIATIPAIVVKNPAIVLSIFMALENKYLEADLVRALEDKEIYESFISGMTLYCKDPTINKETAFSKLKFFHILTQKDKQFEKLRTDCYQVYFKYAMDNKATEEALRIIHVLLEGNNVKDELLAYDYLTTLLKVPNEKAKITAKEHPLHNATVIKRNEVIHYLFKHAQAEYDIQLLVLHRSCGGILNFRYNAYALEHLIKPLVLADDKAAAINTASITNPIYNQVMASLTKPIGILPEQIDTIVKWWGDSLRNKAANSTNSAFFDSGYILTNANAAFSKVLKDLPGLSEEKIQKFEEELKKRIEAEITIRNFYLELKTDYHPEHLLAEAARNAGFTYFDEEAFPWKTSMVVEGATVLEKGTIIVNGKPIELATTKALVVSQYQMALESSFGLNHNESAAAATALVEEREHAEKEHIEKKRKTEGKKDTESVGTNAAQNSNTAAGEPNNPFKL